MINILKPGGIKTYTKYFYQITCPHCGCEFECELEDFKNLSKDITKPLAWIDCPCCNIELTLNRLALKTREEEVENNYGDKSN